jgi:hypothetical protein
MHKIISARVSQHAVRLTLKFRQVPTHVRDPPTVTAFCLVEKAFGLKIKPPKPVTLALLTGLGQQLHAQANPQYPYAPFPRGLQRRNPIALPQSPYAFAKLSHAAG